MVDEAVAERPSRVAERATHVRSGTFGPASEEPYRRRTSDYIRLATAIVIIVATCFHEGDLTNTERELFAFFNGLPDELQSLFRGIYTVGALWAVALVVVAAFVARRWRLGRDLAISAALAWAVGRFLGVIVVDHGSLGDGIKVLARIDESPSFPVVRLAVVAAVICAASPYVTRPVRRGGQTIVLLLALAALYLGTGLPNGVFAAVVLGWGAAAAVHLAFGSPGGRPTRTQVADALDELGHPVEDLEIAPYVREDGTIVHAHDDVGPVDIRVLGRDEADAQLMNKFWRFVFYKDGGPTLHLTRLEDVEQEAFALLLAERAGARVPSVLVVGTAGAGTALLATRATNGRRFADLAADDVTDEVLCDIWRGVACLHTARVAHGRLNARHIVLTADGPEIVEFSDASFAGSDAQRLADVAELLVSTATIVGNDRAVSSARQVLGADDLAAALPYLQSPALSHEMRPHTRRARKVLQDELDALRTAIAVATGVEEPPLQQLYRIDTTNLLMAVGSLIAVFALLSQIGDPSDFWDTISSANCWWLAFALAVSLSTNIATAIALSGTVPIQLPLWRTSELQLSMAFSNLAVPAVGGMAAQVRFLQKQGVDLASAVASGFVLSTAANISTYLVLFAIAVALSPTAIHTGDIPVSSIVSVLLVVLVALILAAVLIRFVPKLRSRVVPRIKSAASTIWAAVRSPRRLTEMIAGNALNGILYGLVMLACIEAFGSSINFWTVLALNIFIGTIASIIPIPGGGTAVGSVGMSGALTAVGVPTEVAVAAVLANQLVCNFIPALPGWVATKDLMNRGYL
jgi:glycosyltransferase 2 family protein